MVLTCLEEDGEDLLFSMEIETEAAEAEAEGIVGSRDYLSQLPNDCLANVAGFLPSGDRKNASLVSKHMLRVEGQSRRRLTLDAARPDLLPSLLSRFDAVTELVVRCHPNSAIDADDALILIGKLAGDRVQELVLIGVNVTCIGIESVGRNFKKLERLGFRGGNRTRIGDEEISCVASECLGLKKISIKGCQLTDQGIKAFALGCPDLVEIKVDKCRGVTSEVVDWLGARRESLLVKLDAAGESEMDSESDGDGGRDGGGGGGGLQRNGVDIPARSVSREVGNRWPPVYRPRFWGFRR